jgi:SAM-dependent methyltransferase
VFEGYETQRERLRRWARQHYIRAFDLTPCRMLDAGCGEGFWGALFADDGFDVCGFDREPAYIETGRKKYPQLELYQSRIEDDLPWPEASFPLIFCRAISHYYAPDLAGAVVALRNMRRYLAPGGLLLVSAYTDGSGLTQPGQFDGYMLTHHSPQDIHATVTRAGFDLWRTKMVGNYVQIGAR